MHDGILSHLFGTRMGLGFLDIEGNKTTLEEYNKFINQLQIAEENIRNLSHELKQDNVFSKNNFEAIIEQLLEQQCKLGNFTYNITKDQPLLFEQIHDNNKVVIYRILQESIQNIIKHAKASIVSLQFSLKNNYIEITIQDNGMGFETKRNHQGIGLKNIASRVDKLNGNLKIKSKINKGTTIYTLIPNIKA